MKKTIGILTYWGVPNYGAFAQAYALNRKISELFPDYCVRDFAYLYYKHWETYAKVYGKPYPKYWKYFIINPYFYRGIFRYLFKIRRKYPHFDKRWSQIPHINIKNDEQLESFHVDIAITGSDSIWQFGDINNDKHLIGNNLDCEKLISYAANFGNIDHGNESSLPNYVATGLKNYDRISVRDVNSYNIVDSFGYNSQIVLDPTLLWDFNEDENIIIPKYKNYILVYGCEFSDKIKNEVIEYSKKQHLMLIGAGLFPKWVDVKLDNIDPFAWMGLFKNAEFVVTSTFHGFMFSLINKKRVLFYQCDFVKNRSAWLVELLKLDSIVSTNISLVDVLNFNWDYNKIDKILMTKRLESIRFIKESISL